MSPKDWTISYTVNLDDLDFMGIVSHYQWLTLMERLRTKLFESHFVQMQAAGLGFVVAEAHVKYLRPAKYLQNLQLKLEVIQLKGSSSTVRHTFTDSEGHPLVVGELTLVCVNSIGRPSAIPEDIRKPFEELLQGG